MDSTSGGDPIAGLVLLAILFALYFLPSIIAAIRDHHNSLSIFLLNLLLGWTVIGWVAALVWSASNPSTTAQPGSAGPGTVPSEPEFRETTKSCPLCGETVKSAAKICRFCRYEFPTDPSSETVVAPHTQSKPSPPKDPIERAALQMMDKYGSGAEEKIAHYCEKMRKTNNKVAVESGEKVLEVLRRLRNGGFVTHSN